MTASADKTARLWDASSGKAIGLPMQHDGKVYSAAFSPDGQRIVTASSDKHGAALGRLKRESDQSADAA